MVAQTHSPANKHTAACRLHISRFVHLHLRQLRRLATRLLRFAAQGVPSTLKGSAGLNPSWAWMAHWPSPFRPDPPFAYSLSEQAFEGNVLNWEHTGKISEELVLKWNEEHGDDPVLKRPYIRTSRRLQAFGTFFVTHSSMSSGAVPCYSTTRSSSRGCDG